MTGERGSLDMSTVVLTVCFVAVFAGIALLAYRSSAKRAAMLQALAEERGWGYAQKDGEQLRDRIEALFPGQVFSLSSIATTGSGVRLFESHHTYFNRGKTDRFSTGCVFGPLRSRPAGERGTAGIFDRNGVDGVWADGQFDLGTGAFSEAFAVAAKDRTAARQMVTPELQAVLLDRHRSSSAARLTIGIDADGGAVLVNTRSTKEGVLELLELCRKIETALGR